MIFKSRFAEWFVRIFLPIATFLVTGFVTSELLLGDGEVDQNHRDGHWEMSENERDISDHYPLVTEFVFK